MKRALAFLAGACLSMSASSGDILAGEAKAGVCASCHGSDGISNNSMWPNLAGQQEQYLAKQLRAFREGTRSDPLMSPMAKELTDSDIDDLSAYYSNLE